jgi:hypothetical protein
MTFTICMASILSASRLEGGVDTSLNLDANGKSWSDLIRGPIIDVSENRPADRSAMAGERESSPGDET